MGTEFVLPILPVNSVVKWKVLLLGCSKLRISYHNCKQKRLLLNNIDIFLYLEYFSLGVVYRYDTNQGVYTLQRQGQWVCQARSMLLAVKVNGFDGQSQCVCKEFYISVL